MIGLKDSPLSKYKSTARIGILQDMGAFVTVWASEAKKPLSDTGKDNTKTGYSVAIRQ
jgi:hypothetical protein